MSTQADEKDLTPAQEDKVFKKGFNAYHAGKDREAANPFPKDSQRFDVWKHGWDSAFECEAMEENDDEEGGES